MRINMLSEEDGKELLRQFPPIEAAFAYGSAGGAGVIEQEGYNYAKPVAADGGSGLPMVDLVFVIEDAEEWHRQNMLLNPDHYTPPFPLSSSMVAFLQDRTGASIWYNAMVPMNIRSFPSRHMKYGVISKQKFLQDLLNWDHLYVAGRLHKPVQMLKSDPLIMHAIERNRENAVRTCMMLLPPKFTEAELYLTIAGLSYMGDPRMSVGENPRKVNNLVSTAMPSYRAIYEAPLNSVAKTVNLKASHLPQSVTLDATMSSSWAGGGSRVFYTQDTSPASRWKLSESLPSSMKRLLMIRSRNKYLKQKPPPKSAVRAALAGIVARAATTQSVKGLMSAGIIKCSVYIFAKISKRFSLFKAPSASFFSVA